MQHISVQIPTITPQARGGRVASAALRHAQQLCEEFPGLDSKVNRYDLLVLVKRVGNTGGFTPKMIQLLDYYMAFTRDEDWEEGAKPIVYQSQAKTALELGVSERQIQRLEQSLFEAGALTWNDSGNHRRYGQRCPKTGRILYAFGVNLTPLAYLRADLETKLQEKELYHRAWLDTKRQISFYRRQICAVLAEVQEEGADISEWLVTAAAEYETLAVSIRTYMDLQALRDLLARHKALHEKIVSHIEEGAASVQQKEPEKMSPVDDENDAHYNSLNQESFSKLNTCRQSQSFQESVQRPSRPKPNRPARPYREEGEEKRENQSFGLQHISLKQGLNAASPRFKEHIPMQPRPMNWNDFVEAAYRLRPELHISQNSWGEACLALRREGAAICLLLTDQACLREDDPVRKPGAYFRAMVRRAKTGELHLHNSILGILKREP